MKRRILIVDDDPVVRHLLSTVLTSAGFSVQSAESGTQCLALLGAPLGAPAGEELRPDIIFLDLQLADMPGTEVLTGIRQLSERIPVVMLSANTEAEVRASFPDIDMDYYLAKPFPPSKLLHLVRSILAD